MHNRGNDYGNMCLCMGWVFYIKLSRSVLFVEWGMWVWGWEALGEGKKGSFASRNVRTHITRSDYLGARGRVICFAEKGDKEVIADWRIQGWTPHPPREEDETYYKMLWFYGSGLVLCETLCRRTTQRVVLINKFQYFLYFAFLQFLITQDVWSPTRATINIWW